ncbi:MAG: TlpA disulfide reductase family protein [Bacteroidales bacterium]|nr:TlpA disulfide reductase family protein [Bacteroidales bacterium]MDD4109129.1 TlpA disulfide reductase family protein [Prolixibacteraceae bacterium]
MRRVLLTSIVLLVTGINGFSQKSFKYIPELLTQGNTATIIYDNRNTSLSGCDPIEGVIYFWENYQWRADDLEMTKNDSVWTAEYTMSDKAALAVVVFNSGEKIDKGGRNTYCQFVLDKSGKNPPSAYIGWGMLRNKTMSGYSIPGFCDSVNSIGDDVMRYWINQELMYNPTERANLFHIAAEFLVKTNADEEKLKQTTGYSIEYVMTQPSPTEKQLLNAKELALRIMNDPGKAAQIDSLIKNRFPYNLALRDEMITKAFRETDFTSKKAMLDEILKYYPSDIYRDVTTEISSLYFGKLIQSVIYTPIANAKDYSLLYKYLHDSPLNQLATYHWHHVQLPLRDKLISNDKLLSISTGIINEMQSRPRIGKDLTISPVRWADLFVSKYRDIMTAHSELLLEAGKYSEALEIAEKISPLFENKSADFNDLYVRILSKNGYDNLIIPYIKLSIGKNAATPEMLECLKADYIKTKGAEKGFDSYLTSLKSAEDMEDMQAKLKSSLIKEKIDLFSFEEMNGGRVDMAAQKGKIIVIDFWATWCAPCKAALPGMQMAVNKYKNDPDVAFYFVATQESKPGFKDELRKFVKEKGYDITVLFDNPDASGKAQATYNNYSRKFKFSGIPHKMIIDGNGYLRWSSTGYYGSPTELADEISCLIELIKSENLRK